MRSDRTGVRSRWEVPVTGGVSPMTSVQLSACPAGRPRVSVPLTRRRRRLVAGLSIATGLGVAALTVAVVDGGAGGLQLAGDTSVVVRSGDTLWSIAADAAPEEDTRAVVDAIMA